MNILKKFGLALFSMMLFCGMSMTAFAYDSVDASARVYKNWKIDASMCSNNGEYRELQCHVRYYDNKNNILFTDEEDCTTSGFERMFCDSKYWAKANIQFFVDGHFIKEQTLRGPGHPEIGVSAKIYKNKKIDASMWCNDSKERQLKCKVRYYNKRGSKFYTDIEDCKTTGFERMFCDGDGWKEAKITYYVDDEPIQEQTLRR